LDLIPPDIQLDFLTEEQTEACSSQDIPPSKKVRRRAGTEFNLKNFIDEERAGVYELLPNSSRKFPLYCLYCKAHFNNLTSNGKAQIDRHERESTLHEAERVRREALTASRVQKICKGIDVNSPKAKAAQLACWKVNQTSVLEFQRIPSISINQFNLS